MKTKTQDINKVRGVKPGYKKTKLGWIPEEWEPIHVGRLVKQLSAGKSVNSHDEPAVNGEPAILKTSCVFGGQFDILQNKRIVESEIDLACVNPIEGRLIISRMNTPDLVGAVGYVDQGSNSVFLPDRLWQTEFYNDKEFSSRWLYFYLNTPVIKSKIKSLATGTSGSMKNLSKGSLLALKLPLPPLPEQRAIAAVLATWDRAIDLTRRLIETKKARQKGLMQQLLSGKKRLDGFEGEWEKVKIGDILKESKIVASVSNEHKRLSVRLNCHGVTARPVRNSSNPSNTAYYTRRAGQFIYGKQNLHKGAIGIIPKELDGFESTIDIPCFDFRQGYHGLWFLFFMSRPNYYKALENISTGTGSKRIQPKELFRLKIFIPNYGEQRAIAAVLSRGEAEIKQSEQYLSTLQQQKKGLMQKLLTGEVRVKELTNELSKKHE